MPDAYRMPGKPENGTSKDNPVPVKVQVQVQVQVQSICKESAWSWQSQSQRHTCCLHVLNLLWILCIVYKCRPAAGGGASECPA
jgi:hypothetical protein